MTVKPREVIYSAMMRSMSFRCYASTVHRPRSPAERALIDRIRVAPVLDQVQRRETLELWLRHGPPMAADVRAEAVTVWEGYRAWCNSRRSK